MRRAALLAVDGGGSKTDVALLKRDGTVLGAARVSGQLDGFTWATWGHIEDKMIAWLQKKFSVPNQVLRPVVRDSLSEFMLYAVKVKQQAGPC